jgi:hypothetical protein
VDAAATAGPRLAIGHVAAVVADHAKRRIEVHTEIPQRVAEAFEAHLRRHGTAAGAAMPALQSALRDRSRYVPGVAVEALERVDSPDAWHALIAFLKQSRWCPYTTPASTL